MQKVITDNFILWQNIYLKTKLHSMKAAIKARDFDPGANIYKEQVFEAIRQAHYNFCNRPGAIGLQFKWMMRER